jgi:hypothetical protein
MGKPPLLEVRKRPARGRKPAMPQPTSPVMIPPSARTTAAYQQCINPSCSATFEVNETHFACPACGDLIDVVYDWDRLPVP